MPAFVTFGRILFAVLFIYSGATKLFAIQQTADFIAAKVDDPGAARALYLAARNHDRACRCRKCWRSRPARFEIIAGLMIALNFGARFFAILLIFFVLVADLLLPRFLEPVGRPTMPRR